MNNIVLSNNIARAIYLVTKNKTQAEQSLIFPKIIQFLVKRRFLLKAGDILLSLSKIINDHEGRIVAKISSAEKISETTNKELAQILTRRYSAKEITLVENLDKKLLGGYKIEVNDEVIDLTIKNRIEKLQEYLITNA